MKKEYLVIFAATIIFLPALFNFFSADDWFHLRIVLINNFRDFLNFFSFTQNAQSAAFYRPLPTQFFFFVFYSLFGLHTFPYYLFVLICFALSLFLVHELSLLLTDSRQRSLFVTLIYGFSVTNFTRIYFLSAFQEILLVIFTILTVIQFLKKNYYFSMFLFILSLMSKETAVITPFILLIVQFVKEREFKVSKVLPFFLILVIYLYLRLNIFGLAEGDTYIWNFSPKTTLNTLTWYTMWSFGAPELFIDYVGAGFNIIPRFFTDYPLYSYLTIFGLLLTVSTFMINFFSTLRRTSRLAFFATFWFIAYLLPVIFLPQHRFALELGLPLFGFGLLLSGFLHYKATAYTFLISFLIYNLAMNHLTYTRHYSTRRALLNEKIYSYVIKNHYPCPVDKAFIFYNSNNENFAKEIELSISGVNMLKTVCQNPDTQTFFEKQTANEGILIPANIFFPI